MSISTRKIVTKCFDSKDFVVGANAEQVFVTIFFIDGWSETSEKLLSCHVFWECKHEKNVLINLSSVVGFSWLCFRSKKHSRGGGEALKVKSHVWWSFEPCNKKKEKLFPHFSFQLFLTSNQIFLFYSSRFFFSCHFLTRNENILLTTFSLICGINLYKIYRKCISRSLGAFSCVNKNSFFLFYHPLKDFFTMRCSNAGIDFPC